MNKSKLRGQGEGEGERNERDSERMKEGHLCVSENGSE